MSKFCGLCSSSPSYKTLPNKPAPPKETTESITLIAAEKAGVTVKAGPIPIHPLLRTAQQPKNSQQPSQTLQNLQNQSSRSQKKGGKGDQDQGESYTASSIVERKSTDFEWAREDQLSVILEIDSTKNTPNWEKSEAAAWGRIDSVLGAQPQIPTQGKGKGRDSWPLRTHWLPKTPGYRSVRFEERHFRVGRTEESDYVELSGKDSWESLGRKGSSEFLLKMEEGRVRPIAAPPRDLESIARIDKSLVFEHFTTEDAWLLGSALRNRLLPIPTPVVINISLANQNQTLFHTCTHSGVMPDNDSWVARKRKTVLRWGVSTWYMSCKFAGDEMAFRDKYGLGNSAGEYAIHGGGVPIRVTGVEGVVAVVVVSGMKQDEDHAVVVEVIRELYY